MPVHRLTLRCAGRARCGFTLIELLVVVGIIAVLIAVLVPSISAARRHAQAVKSAANLRSWGQAQQMHAKDNKDRLAWEGDSNTDNVADDMAAKDWWGHVLPPLVGHESYRNTSEERSQVPLPSNARNSIFIDPVAEEPPEVPYAQTGVGANPGKTVHFFFCYVPNSGLTRTINRKAGVNTNRVSLSSIKNASRTITMLEMRTTPGELKPGQPFRSDALNRAKANWRRSAARHFGGAHLLFADSHVDRYKYEEMTTIQERDAVEPSQPGYNTGKLIWDPFGAAN